MDQSCYVGTNCVSGKCTKLSSATVFQKYSMTLHVRHIAKCMSVLAGERAHLCRLVCALAARICDKYQHFRNHHKMVLQSYMRSHQYLQREIIPLQQWSKFEEQITNVCNETVGCLTASSELSVPF